MIGGWKGCTPGCLEAQIGKKFKKAAAAKGSTKSGKSFLKNLSSIKFGKAQDKKHFILPDDDLAGLYKKYMERLDDGRIISNDTKD